MTSSVTPSLVERRKALDEKFADLSLAGMWQSREPRAELQPWTWHWKDVIAGLEEAGDLYKVPEEVRMRTVQLMNPALRAQKATSRTLQVSIQLLKSGEVAKAHRHTPPQPRFIIQANRAYTVVEGERIYMETGDLIVTPGWAWHDHANPTDEAAIWIDIHDPHLTNYLGANFNEQYGEGETQPITRPEGYHRQRLGLFRTQSLAGRKGAFPIKYSWSETQEALNNLAAAKETDPYDGVQLQYTNPLDGGPAMPTIGCQIQMLRPGETTLAHRHTDTTLYHVVGGHGATIVGKEDEQELAWQERDCFVLPPWRWHRHENKSAKEPAILFSVTDRPAIESLGYHRVDAGG